MRAKLILLSLTAALAAVLLVPATSSAVCPPGTTVVTPATPPGNSGPPYYTVIPGKPEVCSSPSSVNNIIEKNNGTAVILFFVPGPGTVKLFGPQVQVVNKNVSRVARASAVASASTVRLVVRPKGKKRKALQNKVRNLREEGESGTVKVAVQAKIAYNPTSGGATKRLTKRVVLKKKV